MKRWLKQWWRDGLETEVMVPLIAARIVVLMWIVGAVDAVINLILYWRH
jgi:hypothetical protein